MSTGPDPSHASKCQAARVSSFAGRKAQAAISSSPNQPSPLASWARRRAPRKPCWPATSATEADPAPTRTPACRRRGASQAFRALGNRLVGILHGCLTHHVAYVHTTAGDAADRGQTCGDPAPLRPATRRLTQSIETTIVPTSWYVGARLPTRGIRTVNDEHFDELRHREGEMSIR